MLSAPYADGSVPGGFGDTKNEHFEIKIGDAG